MTDITYTCRQATEEELRLTVHHLRDHTEAEIRTPVIHEQFAVLAHADKQLVGSIIGKIYLNWMHMDLVWVDEPFRGKGVGRNLVQQAIEDAKRRGLAGIEVWSQSWQAPEFYKHLGFTELAAIPDFMPGQKRHILRYCFSPAEVCAPISLCNTIGQQINSYFQGHGDSLPAPGLYDRLLPLLEKPLIEATLQATSGNQLKAAHVLGINRNTLRKKMLALGIAE